MSTGLLLAESAGEACDEFAGDGFGGNAGDLFVIAGLCLGGMAGDFFGSAGEGIDCEGGRATGNAGLLCWLLC